MELKSILESLLFSAQKPLSAKEIKELLAQAAQQDAEPAAQAFKKANDGDLERALAELESEHARAGRSYRLACVAGAWQFVTLPEFAPWLRALVGQKIRPPRLTQAGLETLAIIAYRQPMTRAEIEQIRGVSVDGVLQTLLERGLIEPKGRAEAAGRPVTFGTTSAFLEYFGLASLEELPAADELRRIAVQKPEELLTAEPAPVGLATAPPRLETEGAAPQSSSAAAEDAARGEAASPCSEGAATPPAAPDSAAVPHEEKGP